MARRKKPNTKCPHSVVPVEHTGFYPYLVAYLEAMKVRGYRPTTLHRRESDLRRFIAWCDERGLEQPNQVTKPILESYQRYLYYYRQESSQQALSPSSQNRYVSSVKQLFKWLTQQNHLLYNPASEVILRKEPASLPAVLSEEEVEALLNQPDTHTPEGVRDRAIMELLYSTGIRRTELCGLALGDVSLKRKTLYVRGGKGDKDRLLPVGERALYWLERYLDLRGEFLVDLHLDSVFITNYGEALGHSSLGGKVKRYLKHAGIDVPGSCHLLRHAMATHMLEHGADIRYIQAMLGHADLRTTQVYTHVSIRKLQEVHANTHPAKLKKNGL